MLTETTRFELSPEDLRTPANFYSRMEQIRAMTGLCAEDFYMSRSCVAHPALGYTASSRCIWDAARGMGSPYFLASSTELPAWQLVGIYKGAEHRVYYTSREKACVEVDGRSTLVNGPRLKGRFKVGT